MESSKSSKGHVTVLYIIIVILVIALGGEYFYFHHKYSASQAMMAPGGNRQMMMMKGGKGMPPGGMSMAAVTPPAMSDQQTQQLTEGADKSSTQKTFNITAGNYYFVPNKITVNKDDQVTLVMTNAGGVHNINIDAFGVKSSTIKTAEATSVTFTASKTGSFQYYCSIPGHKAKGMWGTLTVK